MSFELGKPGPFQALGRTWQMGKRTAKVIEEFNDWVKSKVGDPYAELARFVQHLKPEDVREKLDECDAIRDQLKKPSLATPVAVEYQSTEVGAAYLLYLIMRDVPGNDGISCDVALEIIEDPLIEADLIKQMQKAKEKQAKIKNLTAPAAA